MKTVIKKAGDLTLREVAQHCKYHDGQMGRCPDCNIWRIFYDWVENRCSGSDIRVDELDTEITLEVEE